MPIYQYHCRNCGANIEKMQSFTADPLVECPECHQPTLKKVLQPAGIIFKGSGWYVTDSKKSSSAVTPPGEKTESKPAESSSTTTTSTETKSSETKPAETKATAPAASTPASTT